MQKLTLTEWAAAGEIVGTIKADTRYVKKDNHALSQDEPGLVSAWALLAQCPCRSNRD